VTDRRKLARATGVQDGVWEVRRMKTGVWDRREMHFSRVRVSSESIR